MDLGIRASTTGTSTFQAEPEKKEEKPVRIFCPQGYAMQRKVEEARGFDYCKERCGKAYDKYNAAVNVAECYWIVKGKELRNEQEAATSCERSL